MSFSQEVPLLLKMMSSPVLNVLSQTYRIKLTVVPDRSPIHRKTNLKSNPDHLLERGREGGANGVCVTGGVFISKMPSLLIADPYSDYKASLSSSFLIQFFHSAFLETSTQIFSNPFC